MIKIVKKETYDLGVNTYFSNGIILSGMRQTNGKTEYNIYKDSLDDENLIVGDLQEGYYELKKDILQNKYITC